MADNEAKPTTREVRHQLTERQFRALAESQGKLGQARQVVTQLEAEAQQVIELVFDAHGVSPDSQVSLDEQTRCIVELVPVEEEAPARAKPRPKPQLAK